MAKVQRNQTKPKNIGTTMCDARLEKWLKRDSGIAEIPAQLQAKSEGFNNTPGTNN
jgi:hypothetical protein